MNENRTERDTREDNNSIDIWYSARERPMKILCIKKKKKRTRNRCACVCACVNKREGYMFSIPEYFFSHPPVLNTVTIISKGLRLLFFLQEHFFFFNSCFGMDSRDFSMKTWRDHMLTSATDNASSAAACVRLRSRKTRRCSFNLLEAVKKNKRQRMMSNSHIVVSIGAVLAIHTVRTAGRTTFNVLSIFNKILYSIID